MRTRLFALLTIVSFGLAMFACGSGAGSAGPGSLGSTGGTPGPSTVSAGNPCNSQPPTILGGTGNVASGDCTMSINGGTRQFRLHVPLNYRPSSSALVIVLHGSRATGTGIETVTHFTDKSDEVGFAVAYPNGLPNANGNTTWNSFFDSSPNAPDDVGFLRQLIVSLQAKIQPSVRRIYVAGFSAGGFMAHRSGAEISDLVAGIGVVEGTLSSIQTTDTRQVPSPVGPVSVIILHGSGDTTVPYCGGGTATFTDTSQEQTFNYWSRGASCASFNTSSVLCDASGNITSVDFKKASNCALSTEVELYKLIGGTHTWYLSAMNDPTHTPYNPALDATTGVVTTDILWNFFNTHPKP